MRITVHLFAAHREAVGASTVGLTLPDGARAGDVWAALLARHPALRDVAAPTAVAVNDEVLPTDRPLAEGDHVALIAPVSGGAEGAASRGAGTPSAPGTERAPASAPAAPVVALVREPIRVDPLLDAVRHPGSGALVLFLGTVREHSRGRSVHHLEYEAYETLALTEMRRIVEHAAERWGVRVAMAHRVGRLEIGEISVAIAVAAPHRREAFEAGRFAIDTLKHTVPVWKKEVWADGAEWIGQEAPQTATADG